MQTTQNIIKKSFYKIEFCKHHIDRVSYKARYYVFENQDDKTDVNFLRYSAFRKGIGLGKSVLIQKDHLEDAEVTINQETMIYIIVLVTHSTSLLVMEPSYPGTVNC